MIRLPRGSDIERTDQLTRYFEERLRQMPEVEQFTSNISTENSYTRVTFPDELETTAVPVAIKDQLFAFSLQFTGAEVRVHGFGPSFYGGGGSAPKLHDPGARLQLRDGSRHRRGPGQAPLANRSRPGGEHQRFPELVPAGARLRVRRDDRPDVVASHGLTVEDLSGRSTRRFGAK